MQNVDLELIDTADLITELLNRSENCLISMEPLAPSDQVEIRVSLKGKTMGILGLANWTRDYIKGFSAQNVEHLNNDLYQNGEYVANAVGAEFDDSDQIDEDDIE